VLIGSDRFAALRSRTGRAGRSRCLAALPALACVMPAIVLAGCGGGGHASSTAAADANGAVVGGTSTSATTTTGAAGGAQGGTSTGTASTATTTTSTASTGAGAPSGSPAGGTVKNGSNDSTSSHGGSSGRPAAKRKGRAGGKTAVGAGSAGSGSPGGGSGANAPNTPNANTGVPLEVDTTSMEPTYQPETKIYYDPTRTHPQVGEVVAYYVPVGAEEGACGEVMAGGRACATPIPGMTKAKEISFKRVVGLPGDTIAIRQGHVIRNGQPELPEPPTLPCEKDERLNCEFPTPITVPAGHYYLLADNRGLYKEDSRIFGAVPQEYILGTVEGS
jgi:signal peptidase I